MQLSSHLATVRTFPRVTSAVRALLFCSLTLCGITPVALAKEKVAAAKNEAPLVLQITDRIKANVSARLGKGPLTHDRYFIVPFAYENRKNEPEFSHTFITVVRVFANGRQRRPHPEFTSGTYQQWSFEAYTISWLPADFMENPHLCVFGGFLPAIFPWWNTCGPVPGKCFNLPDTLKLAVNAKVAVAMWGPYEVKKEAFDLGVARKRQLDKGTIKYCADDRRYCMEKKDTKEPVAINCFHAIASLAEPSPKGGFLNTGLDMWGLNGTRHVLVEYRDRPTNQPYFVDKINKDEDKDLYGFVYSTPGNGPVFNPFQYSSTYRK